MPTLPNPCGDVKPPLFIDVRLVFEFTASTVGYWTGHEWLVEGGVVTPITWEFVRPLSGVD